MRLEKLADPAQAQSGSPGRNSWLITFAIGCNLILLGVAGWAIVRHGSFSDAIRYSAGECLFVDSEMKSFGSGTVGEAVTVTFQLTNKGSRPIRVVGAQVGCSCTAPDDMPFVIEAGQRKPFRVTITLPEEPQLIRESLTLYTNIAAQPEQTLIVTGEARAKSAHSVKSS